jgi:hypothetical protein
MQRMSCDYCRSLAERSQPDAGPCVRLLARRWGGGWGPGLAPVGVAPRDSGPGWGAAARAGVGVDRATSWRPGFIDAAVSFDDSCQVHGVQLGFGESLLVRVDRFCPERLLALAQRYLQSVQIN